MSYDFENETIESSIVNMKGVIIDQLKHVSTNNSEENKRLAVLMKDPITRAAAREKLILGNIPIVINAIKKHNYGIPWEDLYQTAVEHLIEIVDSYDVDTGYAFSTYAISSMNFSLAQKLQTQRDGNLRLPDYLYNMYRRFYKARIALETARKEINTENLRELMNQFTESERTVELHTDANISLLMAYEAQRMVDGDQPFGDEEDGETLFSTVPDDKNAIIELEKSSDAKQLLEFLTEKQKPVVALYYGIKSCYNPFGIQLSCAEIADCMGSSRQNIDAMVKKGVERICKKIGVEYIKSENRINASKRMKKAYADGFDPLDGSRGNR